jgi:hypothetical protein
MTETIEELLAKLKDLDPETCKMFVQLSEEAADGMRFRHDNMNKIDFYILQGVLQDAAAAKGWRFEIQGDNAEYFVDSGPQYECYIRGQPGQVDGIRTIWRSAPSPAEALLAAYVAVLEATR